MKYDEAIRDAVRKANASGVDHLLVSVENFADGSHKYVVAAYNEGPPPGATSYRVMPGGETSKCVCE